jgi:hypothetical protein
MTNWSTNQILKKKKQKKKQILTWRSVTFKSWEDKKNRIQSSPLRSYADIYVLDSEAQMGSRTNVHLISNYVRKLKIKLLFKEKYIRIPSSFIFLKWIYSYFVFFFVRDKCNLNWITLNGHSFTVKKKKKLNLRRKKNSKIGGDTIYMNPIRNYMDIFTSLFNLSFF